MNKITGKLKHNNNAFPELQTPFVHKKSVLSSFSPRFNEFDHNMHIFKILCTILKQLFMRKSWNKKYLKLSFCLSRYIWNGLVGDTCCFNFFPHNHLFRNCKWNFENVQIVIDFIETWWKWPNDSLVVKKNEFGILEMLQSYVSACPRFYPFCFPIALSMC